MSFPYFQYPLQIQVTIICLEIGHQTPPFLLLLTTGVSIWSTFGEGRDKRCFWAQPCPRTHHKILGEALY